MNKYEFSIIASGMDPAADDFEARFFDAGCDDATVSFQKGHIIVDFAREAASAKDAISSAIRNVRQAGATIDRVEPDPLVSLSEIATRTGLSRAALSHYASGLRADGFPPPVARVTSASPLWSWPTVSRWFLRRGAVEPEVVDKAVAIRDANASLDREDEDRGSTIISRAALF